MTADSWCSGKMYLLVRVMLSVMAVLLFEGDRSGYAVRHGYCCLRETARGMLFVMAVLLFEGDRSGYAVRHGCTVV